MHKSPLFPLLCKSIAWKFCIHQCCHGDSPMSPPMTSQDIWHLPIILQNPHQRELKPITIWIYNYYFSHFIYIGTYMWPKGLSRDSWVKRWNPALGLAD